MTASIPQSIQFGHQIAPSLNFIVLTPRSTFFCKSQIKYILGFADPSYLFVVFVFFSFFLQLFKNVKSILSSRAVQKPACSQSLQTRAWRMSFIGRTLAFHTERPRCPPLRALSSGTHYGFSVERRMGAVAASLLVRPSPPPHPVPSHSRGILERLCCFSSRTYSWGNLHLHLFETRVFFVHSKTRRPQLCIIEGFFSLYFTTLIVFFFTLILPSTYVSHCTNYKLLWNLIGRGKST